ncbi:hypothetical protein FA13DRAFT_1735160 [Coprinellus micaceus]|uniref:Uncharacterized protein n=1 Tax=Coprinellus micaceus TaxID=71717 RepID=A0A4Y7T539_COPMI|nr:hypothetical protein FA13DRAFT_1735160 [Coprinellus micaceus]
MYTSCPQWQLQSSPRVAHPNCGGDRIWPVGFTKSRNSNCEAPANGRQESLTYSSYSDSCSWMKRVVRSVGCAKALSHRSEL